MTSIRSRRRASTRYAKRARPTEATRVKVDHLASKWSSHSAELTDAIVRSILGKWTADERARRDTVRHDPPDPADVIGLTEVAAGHRAQAIARVARSYGFTVVQGPLQDREDGPVVAEVALMLRNTVWQYLGHEVAILGPDLGPGAEVIALIVAVEHRVTGARGLFVEKHLPAEVEAGWRAKGARVRLWISSERKLRGRVKAWRKRVRPNFVHIVGDWNLSLFLLWVRTMIRATWPGYSIPRKLPNEGTHAGRRLIDWPLVRGVVGLVMTVLPAHPHSDHRGIRVRSRVRAWAKAVRRG